MYLILTHLEPDSTPLLQFLRQQGEKKEAARKERDVKRKEKEAARRELKDRERVSILFFILCMVRCQCSTYIVMI